MKIIKLGNQNRRDFRADYECEGCGAVELNKAGYDDSYFHDSVIPNMKCKACGKSAKEIGAEVHPLTPKYPDGLQV